MRAARRFIALVLIPCLLNTEVSGFSFRVSGSGTQNQKLKTRNVLFAAQAIVPDELMTTPIEGRSLSARVKRWIWAPYATPGARDGRLGTLLITGAAAAYGLDLWRSSVYTAAGLAVIHGWVLLLAGTLLAASIKKNRIIHQPFRFPDYIWTVLDAHLQRLGGRFAGIREQVRVFGLGGINGEGDSYQIEDILSAEQAREVLEAARKAINEANGWEPDDEKYIEDPAEIRSPANFFYLIIQSFILRIQHNSTFPGPVPFLQKLLEEDVFHETLTIQHPFIMAIRNVYGRLPFDTKVAPHLEIQWYLMQGILLSLVEDEVLMNPTAVLDRLVANQPVLQTYRAALLAAFESFKWPDTPTPMAERPDQNDYPGVIMNEFMITSAGSPSPVIKTIGARPCLIVSMYDPKIRVGLLAHMTSLNLLHPESYRRMIQALTRERVDLSHLEIKIWSANRMENHAESFYLKYSIMKAFAESGVPLRLGQIEEDFRGPDRHVLLDTSTGEVCNLVHILREGSARDVMAARVEALKRSNGPEPLSEINLRGPLLGTLLIIGAAACGIADYFLKIPEANASSLLGASGIGMWFSAVLLVGATTLLARWLKLDWFTFKAAPALAMENIPQGFSADGLKKAFNTARDFLSEIIHFKFSKSEDLGPEKGFSVKISWVLPKDFVGVAEEIRRLAHLEEAAEAHCDPRSPEWTQHFYAREHFWWMADSVLDREGPSNALAVWVARDSEGHIVGARVLRKPEFIEELGYSAVQGGDAVVTALARSGIGTDLRLTSFQWLKERGITRFVGSIDNNNKASINNLMKLNETLKAKITLQPKKNGVGTWYIIDLPAPAIGKRHGVSPKVLSWIVSVGLLAGQMVWGQTPGAVALREFESAVASMTLIMFLIGCSIGGLFGGLSFAFATLTLIAGSMTYFLVVAGEPMSLVTGYGTLAAAILSYVCARRAWWPAGALSRDWYKVGRAIKRFIGYEHLRDDPELARALIMYYLDIVLLGNPPGNWRDNVLADDRRHARPYWPYAESPRKAEDFDSWLSLVAKHSQHEEDNILRIIVHHIETVWAQWDGFKQKPRTRQEALFGYLILKLEGNTQPLLNSWNEWCYLMKREPAYVEMLAVNRELVKNQSLYREILDLKDRLRAEALTRRDLPATWRQSDTFGVLWLLAQDPATFPAIEDEPRSGGESTSGWTRPNNRDAAPPENSRRTHLHRIAA